MALFEPASRTAALDRLLAREHTALLAGNLSDLARIAREKESLIATLADAGPSAARLEHLREKAQRNQGLLAAAALGVRAARDRLAMIKSGPAPNRTYHRDGATAEIEPRRTTGINHRA